jgi:hypothetical protein
MTIANKLSSHLLGITTVAALVAGATPASADICHNVDLAVQNNKNVKIRALSMEYKFTNDNVWRTEGFNNVEVAATSFRTVAFDQDLPGAEGNRLVGLKLHFQAFCGGKWSVEFVSAEDTLFDDTSTCASFSGRSYRLDLSSSDVCD